LKKNMFVKPWNEESEKILKDLMISGRSYTQNPLVARDFSKHKEIRHLTNIGFLDIASNRRKRKTIFVTPPEIKILPEIKNNKFSFKFKKLNLFD